MKIITWNVNGFRSILRQDKFQQILDLKPDFVCFQEIKMNEELIEASGYHVYYNFATRRKGYSGVATLTREQPINIETEIGDAEFDSEGRFLLLEFKDLVLINLYVVNGGRDINAIPYKLKTLDMLIKRFEKIKNKNVVICTDFNIAHDERDVFNYKNNYENVMFTPAERARVDKLLSVGYKDVFRMNSDDNRTYSWWPYMYNSRERNVGWRIDYIFVSDIFYKDSFNVEYLKGYMGSDHAPVKLETK